jgi:hypothetical protein
MALDLSSLFAQPTAQPQQSGLGGLLGMFGGGGGTAQAPAQQQMQAGMGLLNAGAPMQLPSSPMQHPMMGGGGGGMRSMGLPQQGMQPGGAAMGNATGNPFLMQLMQRLQQNQPQQPQQQPQGMPSANGMSPQMLNYMLTGSAY